MSQPSLEHMTVPDAVRPALGVRAWDIVAGPALESIFRGVVWPRNQRLVAECLQPHEMRPFLGYLPRPNVPRKWLPGNKIGPERVKVPEGKHLSPHKGCSCGIYGAWKLNEAHDMGRYHQPGPMPMIHATPKFSNKPKVYGAIAGWGRVVKGSLGFRAQYAKVLALFIPRKEDWQDISELSDLYGIPVVDRTTYRYEWTEA